MDSLCIDGLVSNDRLVIKDHAKNYFSSLFNDLVLDNPCLEELVDIILICVSANDNNILSALLLDEEIRGVVFGMDAQSALGSNGFLCLFFQQVLGYCGISYGACNFVFLCFWSFGA